ncbi:hypothetical protein [Rhodococcus indonesiensis]|uniref:hypothetical protein n=1 Tax=Rhodococcus indonesiensis TaxID=3055869 RepID=UPI0039F66D3B
MPRAAPAVTLPFRGNSIDLLARRLAEHWIGDDCTRPTGSVTATTFLSRSPWRLEPARRWRKSSPRTAHPIQEVFDRQAACDHCVHPDV